MKFRGSRVALLLVLVLSVTAVANEGAQKAAFTDPQKAGPDYQIQGEYAGEVNGVSYGVQVVAQGEGRFDVVVYPQGLPGAGGVAWDRMTAEGETKDGVTKFVSDDGQVSAAVKDNALLVEGGSGEKLGMMKKAERTSPTLGAKAPEGAVVLFDGTKADQFENGEMTEDGLLKVQQKNGVISKPKFQDFSMHIEFRTPFMPSARGQDRGNSGVYLQGRYEVQVLDSFGLEGRDNECGGIYKAAAPKVNMCLPPLAWQTYDIDFTAAKFGADGKKTAPAKVTIKHNGVVIHDNLELPDITPGGTADHESAEPGPLYLQNHGNPVVYRNIWVVEKK
jgi:hypothetical protein